MIIKYSCCLQSLVVLCRFSVSALQVLAMRADFVVDVGARRRRVDSAGRGSQRRALADRFRAALALRPCPLLQVGVEDVFVQFGPVVVVHDLVMVLAVVTDRHGRRRAVDHLAADEVPHLTVGRLAVGGGWVRSSDSRNVVRDVADAPCVVPDCPTLEWSRTVLFSASVSRVVDDICDGPFRAEAWRRPIAVRLVFEHEHERFLLVGGEALRLYRCIQHRVTEYFRSRGGGHAFEVPAESDDRESFAAHITSVYSRPVLDPPSSRPASGSFQTESSWWCCCWSGLSKLCRRDTAAASKQLFLFVTKDRFAELIGSAAASRAEAGEFFNRWRSNVPEDRRWGTASAPSVSVDVDGVLLPRAE